MNYYQELQVFEKLNHDIQKNFEKIMEPFIAIQSDFSKNLEPALQLQKQISDMLAPYQDIGNQFQKNWIKIFTDMQLNLDYINLINQTINDSAEKHFSKILNLQNPTFSYEEIRALTENYLEEQIESVNSVSNSPTNQEEIFLEVSKEAISNFSENVIEIPKSSLVAVNDKRVKINLGTLLTIIGIIIALLSFIFDRIEYVESSQSDAAYQKEFLALLERQISAEEQLNLILESSTLLFPKTQESQEEFPQNPQYIQKQFPSANGVDSEYQNKYPESPYNTLENEN